MRQMKVNGEQGTHVDSQTSPFAVARRDALSTVLKNQKL